MYRSIFAIGDIHGCYDEFDTLLQKIAFNPDEHKLWIAGDLVNRGPKSLTTLRHIKKLSDQGHAEVVLGNHDLHLLAVAYGYSDMNVNDTLEKILIADDADELLTWLRHQPFIRKHAYSDFLMVHAGISPQWNIIEAQQYAKQVEEHLRGDTFETLLATMYGNTPDCWHHDLELEERYRYIINVFTRMRFVNKVTGALDLQEKNKPGKQPEHLCPWYKCSLRHHGQTKIIFGHWASLTTSSSTRKQHLVYHTDTGCVWGNKLSALHLPSERYTRIASQQAL